MYDILKKINQKPKVFERYTAEYLWNDPHTSQKMLEYHLNETIDVSSRNHRFIQKSVDWIVTDLGLPKRAKVVDFGCGPGLYTLKLAKHGCDVTGIDFSKRSIAYARDQAKQTGMEITYLDQNYLDLVPNAKFDLITMIMCDFCALSPKQRQKLLTIFRESLNPGGKVLVDIFSLNAFASKTESASYGHRLLDGFWSTNDYYGFLNTFRYETEKVSLDKYSIFEASRSFEVLNWFQYFDPDSVQEAFEDNGLEIVGLYSDVAGAAFCQDSHEFAVCAQAKKV